MHLGVGLLMKRHRGPSISPPGISGTPVTSASQFADYDGFAVSGASGTAPYSYSIASGSLPAGCTLNPRTGLICGRPTASGTFASIVVRVTDALGLTADLAPFTLTVAADTAFKPADLGSKLIAHFNAEVGVTYAAVAAGAGAVSAWTDQKGGLAPSQATGANQPSYQPATLNGYRPQIRLNGSTTYLRNTGIGSLPSAATAGEMWALLDQAAAAGDGGAARVAAAHGGGASTSRRDIRRTTDGTTNSFKANAANGAETLVTNSSVAFTGLHVVRHIVTGTAQQADLDGSAGSSSAVTPTTGTTNLTIGANTGSTPTQFWNGGIGELIYTTNTLTAGEITNLYAYLNAKKAALSYSALSVDGGGQDTFSGDKWNQHTPGLSYSVQEFAGLQKSKAWRFEVRSGESWASDPAGTRNRSELKGATNWRFGDDIWFSYLMRVRAGAAIASSFNILGQFHSLADDGSDPAYGTDEDLSPPFAINLMPTTEVVRIIRRYSTVDPSTVASVTQVNEYDTAQIVRDYWYPVVGNIQFATGGTGKLKIWWDGSLVVNQTGINIGFHDKTGPYWKFGIYRAESTETLVVDYANFEMGLTDLSARVGAPLPII
jgi:hypothetical protein